MSNHPIRAAGGPDHDALTFGAPLLLQISCETLDAFLKCAIGQRNHLSIFSRFDQSRMGSKACGSIGEELRDRWHRPAFLSFHTELHEKKSLSSYGDCYYSYDSNSAKDRTDAYCNGPAPASQSLIGNLHSTEFHNTCDV